MTTTLSEMPLNALLQATASKSPTPGGGAIAATTGALAAALANMVVSYSLNRKDLSAHQHPLQQAQQHLTTTTTHFLALGDEDAHAYANLNTLQRLPPDNPQRASDLPAAIEHALNVPLRTLHLSVELATLCANLTTITNKHLASDLKIAAVLAEAAARASLCNVLVNAPLLTDQTRRASVINEAGKLVTQARSLAATIENAQQRQ
ncbi:MAG: cyclodeaminase/cyclohydrolase family protein [bacterium]